LTRRRITSIALWRATEISQPRGSSGVPSFGQRARAAATRPAGLLGELEVAVGPADRRRQHARARSPEDSLDRSRALLSPHSRVKG
jgi:hypothetical protein